MKLFENLCMGLLLIFNAYQSAEAASSLSRGQTLYEGQSITSPNGQFVAIFQYNGRLRVFKDGERLWETH